MQLKSKFEKWVSINHPEDEIAIKGRSFNILLIGFWTLMVIISVILVVHWILIPHTSYGLTTVFDVIFVNTMLATSLVLSKRGHLRPAIWTFLITLLCGTAVAQVARGETNAIIMIYPIIVLTAGLLLSVRSALFFLMLTIGTHISATLAIRAWGPYLELDAQTMALNNIMAVVATLVVILIITWLFTKNIHDYIRVLETRNREKETLLQEIHHRVKNNLQVVSSLLNLQMESVGDAETRQMFRENVGRVKSMALVHEMLYSSRDISNIAFSAYVDRLLRHLGQTRYGTDGISFQSDIDDSVLDVETTLSLGLIINELGTNSMKHAFTSSESHGTPKITVKFRKHIDHMELIVADNGKGISGTGSLKNPETLGMQLVRTLVEELKGEMDIMKSNGTTITMRFENAG